MFLIGIIAGGADMTIGQIAFIGATTLTKNTKVLIMFGFASVIEGNMMSAFKSNETINPICTLGTVFIVINLSRVVSKGKYELKAGLEN